MIVFPDGFAWPEQLTAEQLDWIVAWAERLGDVFLARAAIMRDEDADGGLTLALVIDRPGPGSPDGLRPFAITVGPADFPDRQGGCGAFPFRYVVAIEWPRFESLAAQPPAPSKPVLSLVPMETP